MLTQLLGISRPPDLDDYLKSPRLRVVINALHAKSGGGVTYLSNVLPLLAEDPRLELHIFLHHTQLQLFQPLDQRIIVHAFDFPVGLARLMLWEQAVLPLMARVMSADLIFSPANFGALAVKRQVILLRNALAVAKTETRWSKRLYWFALGVITFISLVRSNRAVAVSDYAAQSLTLGLGRRMRNKIRIIHHGIAPVFSPDHTVEREDFILAVSDIYVQKNLHTLFQAVKPVFDRRPELKLRIAGQKIDSWYFDRVVEMSEKMGISDRIEFMGRLTQPQLLSLYRTCRLFVFPSTAETFGNPLVEAMACGAPIVSSHSAAMPEIVGDAAVLCDPLDVQDMSRAINMVLDDADLRSSLSQRGIERSKIFSWEVTAKNTAEVLIEAGQAP